MIETLALPLPPSSKKQIKHRTKISVWSPLWHLKWLVAFSGKEGEKIGPLEMRCNNLITINIHFPLQLQFCVQNLFIYLYLLPLHPLDRRFYMPLLCFHFISVKTRCLVKAFSCWEGLLCLNVHSISSNTVNQTVQV